MSNKSNSQLARYFNNKHSKQNIIYKGRVLPLKKNRVIVDVKIFICPHDTLVQELVQGRNFPPNMSNDNKAWELQKFLMKFMRYVYDEKSSGHVEYWQFPFETIHLRTGDCEDGSILLTSLMIAAGIPSFRVRTTAGLVETGDPHAPTGGHAYTTYLRESDNQWVILDWCYLPDNKLSVNKKPIIKDNPKYKKVWFSFNNQHAWGEHAFEFNKIKDLENLV